MDLPVSLCQFSGRVLLVVNTASECGYAPQYEEREGESFAMSFAATATTHF
jgi:glutathione peroxidase-family protein